MAITTTTVISNFFWRLAERVGAQVVTLLVSIVLARILEPEVFGVLALVIVFTSILQVFVDSGLGTALIQKKNVDELDFSSVFYFNIAACVVLYMIMFFSAPLIAQFYKMPDLIPVVRVISLTLILSGVKNVQQAYVSRNMLFKRFFLATLGGTIGAAALGIVMAYKGYGVWALVAQYLFNTACGTVILWVTVNWRPKWQFSFERLKGLLSFGYKLLGVSILSTVYNDARSLIIGKMYTPSDLAFYNRGQQFPRLISMNVDSAIDSVLLPTMSQKQDDIAAIKRMARRSIQMGTYVIMPLMMILAVCAEPLVRLVLTDKWLPCIPFLRIMCFTFSFFSIFTTNYNIYKSLGRSDVYFKVTIWSKLIGLVILFSTMWFGVIWIAYGLIIANILNQIVCIKPSEILCDYKFSEQIADFLPNFIASLFMGIVMAPILLLSLPDWMTIFLQLVIGLVSYICLSYFTNNASYNFIVAFLKQRVKNTRRIG